MSGVHAEQTLNLYSRSDYRSFIRSYFINQDQICKTKRKTGFLVWDRSCRKIEVWDNMRQMSSTPQLVVKRHGRQREWLCCTFLSRMSMKRSPGCNRSSPIARLRITSYRREAAAICPRPCDLDFWPSDLETLKVVSDSRVTWATSLPILVFLCLSVLDLGPMYAKDRQTTEWQRASSPRRGGITTARSLTICDCICLTVQ